jgi:hypothetical protein
LNDFFIFWCNLVQFGAIWCNLVQSGAIPHEELQFGRGELHLLSSKLPLFASHRREGALAVNPASEEAKVPKTES